MYKTRHSLSLTKRIRNPPQTFLQQQSGQYLASLQQKQHEEEKRKQRIIQAQKLQKKIYDAEKKMKESMKKAKMKREEKMMTSRGKEKPTKKSTKSTKTAKGSKKVPKKVTTKAIKNATKEKVPKGKSAKVAKETLATPTMAFSSFPASFGAPASAVPKSIASRTDIDLTGYNYGVENTAAPCQLDLVFCLDCTASMGSVIRSCQDSIVNMVNTIISSEGQDVRLCLIPYDHHLSEQYCTKVYPFTRDTTQMLKNVNEQSAGGGGDGPEAVTAAMFEAVCLDWRENAAKIVIFMADAGPHGLESTGDSYPNGDPDGKDPLAIAREMITLGISVYPILSIGSGWWSVSQICQDFFAAIATITGGQCLRLADANLLSDCIITGIRENIDLESNLAVVRAQLEQAAREKGSALTEAEAEAISASVVSTTGRKPRSLPEDKLIKVTFEKFSQVSAASTLGDLKASWNAGGFAAASTGPTITETAGSRMARMAVARESRPTDPVLVEIVREGSKLRAKVISPGYDPSKNCQFPRDIREEGKKFQVDGIINAGSFYRVKGNITPV